MRIGKPKSSEVAAAAAVTQHPAVSFPERRKVFSASRGEWLRALAFLLSMSALGLHFYPALLVIIALMVNSYRRNIYHFIIQLLLFCGDFDIVVDSLLVVKRYDFLIVAGWICLIVIAKRQKELKRSVIAFLIFVGATLAIAMLSIESMAVQIKMMRLYFSFVVFTVPLYIFRNRKFDPAEFFRVLGVYALIIVSFYILDGFIVRGWIFIPASWSEYGTSTFYSPIQNIANFSYFPRKYPRGLNILFLMVFPLIHYYKFSWKQWILVGLAFVSCRTMSVITAFFVTLILFKGKGRQLLYGIVAGIVAVVSFYYIDVATGGFLRLASTVDQFKNLEFVEDREDLAEFGSTRAAQIIPKMELLYDQHREWIGFGFLHPDDTKAVSFQLSNDLYTDIEQADEVATAVEESHFQTILYVGYIGLILQTAFYIALYFIIRRLPLASYYLSAFVATSIAGIGGFASINSVEGAFLLAWTFAVALLASRKYVGTAAP